MIDAAHVQMMARYNAWQNTQIAEALEGASQEELAKDRGAFFGSILHTLSHLLWGDTLWMNRFEDCVDPNSPGMADGTELVKTYGEWQAARVAMDQRISDWAAQMSDDYLKGDLSFYSGILQSDITRPAAPCVTHFFNHQTHHRGQVHAMITAAGMKGAVSDLFLMDVD